MTEDSRLWGQRPYHTLSYELNRQFGCRVYKLSLDGGMTCPNRDGSLGRGGCIFCSQGGSGDFTPGFRNYPDIGAQIEAARRKIAHKAPDGPYIAYFQSFTNTYAPVSYLSELFSQTLSHPQIAALSIGTRPDCLEEEKIQLLARLNRQKPVWVELGLQTIHPDTAELIRRGYPLSCFADTAARLKDKGLTVIVHLILGLPGESREQMLQSVDYISRFSPALDGIKLQLLHILKGTDLAAMYQKEPFPLFFSGGVCGFHRHLHRASSAVHDGAPHNRRRAKVPLNRPGMEPSQAPGAQYHRPAFPGAEHLSGPVVFFLNLCYSFM